MDAYAIKKIALSHTTQSQTFGHGNMTRSEHPWLDRCIRCLLKQHHVDLLEGRFAPSNYGIQCGSFTFHQSFGSLRED
jgi:hypothetical protein